MSTATTPTQHPPEPSGSPRLADAGPGIGIAVACAVVALCDSISVSPGEPGWLRWLRVCADHPIRVSIAASLLFVTFSSRTRELEQRDGSRSA